jgi:hypothetical protein
MSGFTAVCGTCELVDRAGDEESCDWVRVQDDACPQHGADAVRKATIRDICRREGHGPLVDITSMRDLGARTEKICRRGCGVRIFQLTRAHTVDELRERCGEQGVIRVRGDVELWPESTP